MPKALSVRVCKTRMLIDQKKKKTSVCWCWYRYRSGGRCGERGGGSGREKEAGAEISAVCRCKSNKESNWKKKKCMLSISLNKEGFSASLAEVAGWPRDASVPRLLIVCRIDAPHVHVSHLMAQSTCTIQNTTDLLPYRYLYLSHAMNQ